MINIHGGWHWATCSTHIFISTLISNLERDQSSLETPQIQIAPSFVSLLKLLIIPVDMHNWETGRKHCMRESRFKKMLAACEKINKGGVRGMNAKNHTPKYRTEWHMGEMPEDWSCSKVSMNQ